LDVGDVGITQRELDPVKRVQLRHKTEVANHGGNRLGGLMVHCLLFGCTGVMEALLAGAEGVDLLRFATPIAQAEFKLLLVLGTDAHVNAPEGLSERAILLMVFQDRGTFLCLLFLQL
jgi:hypothetical protein